MRGIVLNAALAKMGGTSPVEKGSPLGLGMIKAISRANPGFSLIKAADVYPEVVMRLKAENFAAQFMKIAPEYD